MSFICFCFNVIRAITHTHTHTHTCALTHTPDAHMCKHTMCICSHIYIYIYIYTCRYTHINFFLNYKNKKICLSKKLFSFLFFLKFSITFAFLRCSCRCDLMNNCTIKICVVENILYIRMSFVGNGNSGYC